MLKLKKSFGSSCFFVILLIGVFSGVAIDDNSLGDLLMDTVADPPSFVDWYETTELIYPTTDVSFFAEVLDIDNSSGQLTVTLYYTYSNFATQNISFTMSYVSLVALQTYRFEYTFTGMPDGTYLTYYYHAFDGTNIVKEDNSGLFYDIQWSFPPVTIDTPLLPDVDYPRPIFEVPNYLLIFLALSILLLVIAIFMNMSKRRIESV